MNKTKLRISLCSVAAFLLWTWILCSIDLQPIGPNGSVVGLSKINALIHDLTGVHFSLYVLTDWLSLVPIVICIGFGMLGFWQWIQRKRIRKVDGDILLLGGYYLLVMVIFVFFENCIVNYRPVLIDGILEASYPSSTTLLVICVMSTAIMQFRLRIKNHDIKQVFAVSCRIFIVLMVILRFLSGVHWFSDIIGGILLSAALVTLYSAFVYPGEK